MKALRIITIFLFILSLALYLGVSYRYNNQLDRVSPVIRCETEVLEVSVNAEDSELLAGVTATDNRDGDLTDRIIVGDVSKLVGTDLAKVTCLVFDSDDNMASLTRQVRYTDYRRPMFQLTEPLVYASTDEARLLSRVRVTDSVDGDISHKARVSTLWPTEKDNVPCPLVAINWIMHHLKNHYLLETPHKPCPLESNLYEQI